MDQLTFEWIGKYISQRDAAFAHLKKKPDFFQKTESLKGVMISSMTLTILFDGQHCDMFGFNELRLLKYLFGAATKSYGKIMLEQLMWDELSDTKNEEENQGFWWLYKSVINPGDPYLGPINKSILALEIGVLRSEIERIIGVASSSTLQFSTAVNLRKSAHVYTSRWQPIARSASNEDEVIFGLGRDFSIQQHLDEVAKVPHFPGESLQCY